MDQDKEKPAAQKDDQCPIPYSKKFVAFLIITTSLSVVFVIVPSLQMLFPYIDVQQLITNDTFGQRLPRITDLLLLAYELNQALGIKRQWWNKTVNDFNREGRNRNVVRTRSGLKVRIDDLEDGKLSSHLKAHNTSLPSDYKPSTDDDDKDKEYGWILETKHKMGQFIYQRLNKKENGFFVEAGAYDGFWLSNTLWLERVHGWTGLLIEFHPAKLDILKKRNRRAWVADVCLSTKKNPQKLNFTLMKGGSSLLPDTYLEQRTMYVGQCYPLHMILDGIGVKEVDYLSLDGDGDKLAILKTIPWERFTIKLISFEKPRGKADEELQQYLKDMGYQKIRHIYSEVDIQDDDVYELKTTAN